MDEAGIEQIVTRECGLDGAGGGSSARVVRGGSWNNDNPDNLRASNRNRNDPTNRNNNLGLRCGRVCPVRPAAVAGDSGARGMDPSMPGSFVRARPRPRLGVSACLLGEETRYDGGHKRDRLLVETFGPRVEWVPVCPEVECGLPVPRDPMRLVGDPAGPRLVVIRTGEDLTGRMEAWIRERLPALEALQLDGFIFKARSPSCGLARVQVYGSTAEDAPADPAGVGLFARAVMDRLGRLPVEEEGRLLDAGVLEGFMERVFAFRGAGR